MRYYYFFSRKIITSSSRFLVQLIFKKRGGLERQIIKRKQIMLLLKSNTTKVVAGFVGIVFAVSMFLGASVAPAHADALSDLQAQIAQLTTQLAALQGSSSTTSTSSYTFSKNLTVGSTGVDVMNLQKVLNMSADTKVASTGAGSPGNETSYFGPATKAAVMKFQSKHGISPVAGYVGPVTRAKLNTMGGVVVVTPVVDTGCTGGAAYSSTTGKPCTTTVVPTGTTVMVSLSPDSPSNGAIIQGQALADLAHFTFTNTTSAEAKVTKVVLNRIGISNDSVLVNVNLFNGSKRAADSATVSSGVITFNDPSGLFMVPAGASVVISVKADILDSTAGQIVGVQLTSVESSVPASGTFPIMGGTQSVAAATLATGVFVTAGLAPTTADVDPQDDYKVWEEQLSVGTRALDLKNITFRQIGSVTTSDLQNFELFIDSVKVGNTVASLDSNGYVSFDLSASPVRLATGSRTIKLMADIVGGSTRTFSFSLRQASDVMLVDSELKQPILSTITAGTFSAQTSGVQTISAGTLTITKKTDSPSGNINPDASNVVLATFELKAAGEAIKVETLTVKTTVAGQTVSLRNGTLFANGVQVGSTQNISGAIAGTAFSLGSALKVTPGTPVTLEVKADIYDNDVTQHTIVSGDTITATIVAGSSNLQRTSALTYFSNSAVSGNTRTVSVGAVTGSKYSAYGSQSVVVPQTAYKIGDFRVTANSAESVNLNTITLALGGDSVAASTTDLYVKYGTKTTSVKATGASSQSWNISEPLAAGATMAFEVYGTLSSTFLTGSTTIPSLTVAGTSASNSSVSTGAVVGQTITAAAGSVAATALTDSSVATTLLVGGNTGKKVASFRLTAVNQDFKVTDIALKVTNANSSGAIVRAVLKNGSTEIGTISSFNSVFTGTTTGLALKIPSNDSAGALVDVYLDLNTVSSGSATSTANVKVTLEGFKYQPWTGGTEAEYATDQAASNMYVVKSKPTVNMVAQASSILSPGSGKVLAKVKVDADAANQIGWKKIVFTITKTAAVTVGATSTMQLVDSNNNVISGTFATSTASVAGGLDALGTTLTSGTISFVADSEQQVSSSETYSLKSTIGGTWSGLTYLSVNVAAPTSSIATPDIYSVIAGAAGTQTPSFVWSDRSANSHSETTADWLNDYKVKELPTDSQTLSVTI